MHDLAVQVDQLEVAAGPGPDRAQLPLEPGKIALGEPRRACQRQEHRAYAGESRHRPPAPGPWRFPPARTRTCSRSLSAYRCNRMPLNISVGIAAISDNGNQYHSQRDGGAPRVQAYARLSTFAPALPVAGGAAADRGLRRRALLGAAATAAQAGCWTARSAAAVGDPVDQAGEVVGDQQRAVGQLGDVDHPAPGSAVAARASRRRTPPCRPACPSSSKRTRMIR